MNTEDKLNEYADSMGHELRELKEKYNLTNKEIGDLVKPVVNAMTMLHNEIKEVRLVQAAIKLMPFIIDSREMTNDLALSYLKTNSRKHSEGK